MLLGTTTIYPSDLSQVVARAAAIPAEGAWRLLRLQREVPLTRFRVRILGEEAPVSDAKTRRELGYACGCCARRAWRGWRCGQCQPVVDCRITRLKQYKAVATRYDKLACRYQATITIAVISGWLTPSFSPRP